MRGDATVVVSRTLKVACLRSTGSGATAAIFGVSMGGMQALQWGISYPGFAGTSLRSCR